MKLYFFDIPNSHYETIVNSEEYDALEAKKITDDTWAMIQTEADRKWQHHGDGPYVTYTEHRSVSAALLRLLQAADSVDTVDNPELQNAIESARETLKNLNASPEP